MDRRPPKLAQQFLLWFLRKDLTNEVQGDLEERFQAELRRRSLFRARLDYWLQVIHYLRPFAFRSIGQPKTIHTDMIASYFTIARRSFLRQHLYSLIKVGSLALGVAACIVISLFIADELNYDRQFAGASDIYRVVGVTNQSGEINKGTPFPAPMAAAIKSDFPEVLAAGRYNNSQLFGAGACEVRPANRLENGYDEGVAYVDPELVRMLKLTFLFGSAERALQSPRSVVLTRKKAEKYFPGQDPVGKLLVINDNDKEPYTIGGVVEDFQSTTQFAFEIMITTAGLEFWKGEQNDWGASNYMTYVKVDKNADISALEKKMTSGVLEKYVVPMLLRDGMSHADVQTLVANAWIELQPLTRVHLYSSGIHDGLEHGDIRLVWLFGSVAGFILLIAAVNFINLSTARSANRAKEVGIRKVSGSQRQQLLIQFMTESVLYSGSAFVVGIVVAGFSLPYFNDIAGKQLSLPWMEWQLYPVLMGLVILFGILAGAYPAVYLSSFQPIQVLKGKLTQGSRGSTLRSALVVFQFATSVILLVGTVTIYRQLTFILHKDVGFDKEQVVLLEGGGSLGRKATAFREQVTQLASVEQATLSGYLPVHGMKRNGNSFWHDGKEQAEKPVIAEIWRVDPFYIQTLGISVKEGRNFMADIASDSSAVVVNEAMARDLGGGDVIGMKISNSADHFTIIGVIRDFHFSSFRERIGPLCLRLGESPTVVAVRIKAGSPKQAVADLEATWHKFLPEQPFRYSFLDDRFGAMYQDVYRMTQMVTAFSVLAILVACLGLFGLSSFMIEQRNKEISIRMVHGASGTAVFRLLTGGFLRLVFAGILVAVPLSGYLMNRWLQNFVYRVEMDWMTFAVAGIASAGIALGTVSSQAWKAGKVSPVKNLRSS